MIKSNKPRGEVKLDKSDGSPVISKTANPMRADVNQARGPRVGNNGNTTKQGDFLAEKSHRSSYFQDLANMVTGALESRGSGMKHNRPAGDDVKALTSLKGDFGRAKRGPTKGNK